MLDIIFSQGVVLSHENLIANVAGSSLNIRFYPSDVLVFCIYTQIKLFVLDQLIQFTSALNICDNNFVDHSSGISHIYLWLTSTRGLTRLQHCTVVLPLDSTKGYADSTLFGMVAI